MKFFLSFILVLFLTISNKILVNGQVVWTNALTLGVGGRPFPTNTGNLTFARWPANAQFDLNNGEWTWGLSSAGLFVQFYSNATSIHVNYTLRYAALTNFSNFSPIGYSGVDLYAFDETLTKWRWIASAFEGLQGMSADGNVLESPLYANSSGWPVGPQPATPSQSATSRFRLHFPNYNGVLDMNIGVPSGASLIADQSWAAKNAAIYLGTSITQGGVVTRPGQAYVSTLSRELPVPVINQGLCGSCRLEPGLAKWVVQMPKPPV
jgi:N-terminus of Esterase_SGNH_hydro-type/GDSL-like Lipase/Acylhydrolase family